MKNTNHIISLISTIRDKANKLILAELKKNSIDDLAPTHGEILQILFHSHKSVTMQDLAQKINRDKSTITALVNKLAKLGFIEKIKSIDDNRVTIIVLTKKGWELEKIFNDISKILLDKVYKDFTNKEKKEVINVLEKIKNNI